MGTHEMNQAEVWRLIVVGGQTRNIGKTQLVCDVIKAFPKVHWIAGKITQLEDGSCAQNVGACGCAPTEHLCALDWGTHADTGTDSARFLAAGAKRSFWLRTKWGFLAECLPLLRQALGETSLEVGPDDSQQERANRREQFSDAICEAFAVLCRNRSG